METRYQRQELLSVWGATGQESIAALRPLVVGAGGLGSHIASYLVRSGVGDVVVVDRDRVELSNLHRVGLYGEADVGQPKAEQAATHLHRISATAQLRSLVAEVSADTLAELIRGRTIVFDGTDNLETRAAINQACVTARVPWIYGGVLGTQGMVMPILPGRGPCLACAFPTLPPREIVPTAATVGVLPTLPALVAAWQVSEGFKVALGWYDSAGHGPALVYIDPWQTDVAVIPMERQPGCPVCGATPCSPSHPP